MWKWAAPSMVPAFLPWLAILALLALKRNRCASAWWIWVPLLCVGGAILVPQSLLRFLPSSQFEMFLEWIGAFGFGAAAVWLVAGYLGGRHRVLGFLGMLAVLEVFSAGTFLLVHGQDSDSMGMLIPLAVVGLVASLALSLAGLICRGRYGWLRLSLWLLVTISAVWALVILPLFIYARIASGGRVPLTAVFGAALSLVLMTVGVLLPYMVLAFVNGFYRERLKGLLRLEGEAPPVISPPDQAVTEVNPAETNAGPRSF